MSKSCVTPFGLKKKEIVIRMKCSTNIEADEKESASYKHVMNPTSSQKDSLIRVQVSRGTLPDLFIYANFVLVWIKKHKKTLNRLDVFS